MAGPETIYRIIQKIEVVGAKQASKALDDIGKTATKSSKATDSIFKSFLKADLVASAIKKTVAKIVDTLKQMVRHAWNVGLAYEAAGSRVQGLALGLVNLGTKDPMEKVARSQKIALATMKEFKQIAMDTATPIAEIENAHARINPILAGMGKNQKEVLKFTNMSTAAAKVYGERSEQAGSIVAKAIAEGVVEGETAFARAFKAQAAITSKMPVEKRIKKIVSVLKAMGAPVKDVTKDTAGALMRWKILSDDILQRVTLPIFQKIGSVVGDIVSYLEKNEAVVNGIVHEVQEWVHVVFDVGSAIWDSLTALDKVFSTTEMISKRIVSLQAQLKFVGKIVDVAAFGFKLISEAVKVIIDPERGMGKMYALSKAIEVKWGEIKLQIVKVVSSFAKMAAPDWILDKIPGMKTFFKSLDGLSADLEKDVKKTAKSLRAMEKKLGMEPLTETTRKMLQQEMDAVQKELKRKGIKFNQNIGTIAIRQDFRDQDPDRVMVEFVQDMERLGEAALQSSVGGAATQFEGGATY